MTLKRQEPVQGISLHLHGVRVGVVARFAGNKNILTFDPEYAATQSVELPIVTLQQHDSFPLNQNYPSRCFNSIGKNNT
ncbi:hypothetical protein [Ferrimonas lipolytica]|uniref:HipA N-terminal subdomain 1 domain-containing protein n=1 Tax=Ferrimonas lipolytica TaxID=2724191 RepID=A0A6H1UFV7_9GAMM|nr:hypothetical protein [Ferrimonas lipolytica]QIZ77708.1 hypothetical protein HER31_12860 [Ferrimonas lipolytica]